MKGDRAKRLLASLLLAGAAAAALAALPWPIAARRTAASDGFEITSAEIEAAAGQIGLLERRLRERWSAVVGAADALASHPRTAQGHPVRGDGGPGASGFATAERVDEPAQ